MGRWYQRVTGLPIGLKRNRAWESEPLEGRAELEPSGKPKPVDQVELERLRARVAELETRELARKIAEADSAPGVVTRQGCGWCWGMILCGEV
jgi:hypothetical protein